MTDIDFVKCDSCGILNNDRDPHCRECGRDLYQARFAQDRRQDRRERIAERRATLGVNVSPGHPAPQPPRGVETNAAIHGASVEVSTTAVDAEAVAPDASSSGQGSAPDGRALCPRCDRPIGIREDACAGFVDGYGNAECLLVQVDNLRVQLSAMTARWESAAMRADAETERALHANLDLVAMTAARDEACRLLATLSAINNGGGAIVAPEALARLRAVGT